MDLQTRLDYFRKEDDEILLFLERWKDALQMVACEDDRDRLKGLAQLREMESELLSIQEHCHAEERTVESSFQAHLDDESLARLRREHDLLRHLSNDFLRELRFATLLRTGELIPLGTELLGQLRRHIAYEAALLHGLATA